MLTVCSLEVHVVSMVQQSDMVNVEWFILRSKENNLFFWGGGGRRWARKHLKRLLRNNFGSHGNVLLDDATLRFCS